MKKCGKGVQARTTHSLPPAPAFPSHQSGPEHPVGLDSRAVTFRETIYFYLKALRLFLPLYLPCHLICRRHERWKLHVLSPNRATFPFNRNAFHLRKVTCWLTWGSPNSKSKWQFFTCFPGDIKKLFPTRGEENFLLFC